MVDRLQHGPLYLAMLRHNVLTRNCQLHCIPLNCIIPSIRKSYGPSLLRFIKCRIRLCVSATFEPTIEKDEDRKYSAVVRSNIDS